MPLVTRSAYANYRKGKGLPGTSTRAVLSAIECGRITTDRGGLIDVQKADVEWEMFTQPSIQDHTNQYRLMKEREAKKLTEEAQAKYPDAIIDFGVDYNKSRARREFFDSELARLKYEEKNLKLIEAVRVKKLLFEAAKIIRVGHEDVVSQLAPDLAAETHIGLIERLLKKGLDALDNALADKIETMCTDTLDNGEQRDLEDQ